MRYHTIWIVGLGASATALAQVPSHEWHRTVGSPPADAWCFGAAPDLAGGVIVAGSVDAGNADGFLSRYSRAGALIWTRQFGTPSLYELPSAICVTPEAIFVGGSVVGPQYDIFVMRFTSVAEQVWHRTFGSWFGEYLADMCCDGAGGVYIVGDTEASSGVPNVASYDCFLTRNGGDGTQLWIREIKSAGVDRSWCALPDGAGGVFVAGSTTGVLGTASQGGADCWLARYDASGERLWILQFGTPLSQGITGLCSDGAGGLYASGWTFGSFGGVGAGDRDAVVMRMSAEGQMYWIRQFGTATSDSAQRATPDGAGGVYIYGYTTGSLAQPYFGGEGDLFLARYNGSGEQLSMRQFGTEHWDLACDVAPDTNGGVYVVGYRRYSSHGGWIGTLAHFPGVCYANCDASTSAPSLNAADFSCFLQRFAAADPYANCDESTSPPLLNVLDFVCFLQKFIQGCG